MQNNEGRVRELIAEQAADAGLWFHAETAAEAYVQAALRRLHAVIEGDEIMAVVSEPAPSSEEGGEPTAGIDLAWAAQQLVDRMKMCHEDAAYKSVWMVNQLHVGSYKGPTYTYELRQLEQALKDRPEMAGGEGNTDGNGVRPDHKSEGGNHSVPVQVDLLRPSPQSSPPPDAKVGEHPSVTAWKEKRGTIMDSMGRKLGDHMAVALQEQAQKIEDNEIQLNDLAVAVAKHCGRSGIDEFDQGDGTFDVDDLIVSLKEHNAEFENTTAALTLSSQRCASLEKVVEAARNWRDDKILATEFLLEEALDALPQARAEQKP